MFYKEQLFTRSPGKIERRVSFREALGSNIWTNVELSIQPLIPLTLQTVARSLLPIQPLCSVSWQVPIL